MDQTPSQGPSSAEASAIDICVYRISEKVRTRWPGTRPLIVAGLSRWQQRTKEATDVDRFRRSNIGRTAAGPRGWPSGNDSNAHQLQIFGAE